MPLERRSDGKRAESRGFQEDDLYHPQGSNQESSGNDVIQWTANARLQPFAVERTSGAYETAQISDIQYVQENDYQARESLLQVAERARREHVTNSNTIYEWYQKRNEPISVPNINAYNAKYLTHLRRISKENSNVRSYIKDIDKESETHKTIEKWKNKPRALVRCFYRAVTRDAKKESMPTKAGLHINLNPEYATNVFKYANELVDQNKYVRSTKIAGPEAMLERKENMFVYLVTDDETVATSIARDLYSSCGEHCFISFDDGFSMKKEVAPGIRYAEQYSVKEKEPSYGRSRTNAIEEATKLYEQEKEKYKWSLAQELSYEEVDGQLAVWFQTTILPAVLRAHRIDPNHPYKNLRA